MLFKAIECRLLLLFRRIVARDAYEFNLRRAYYAVRFLAISESRRKRQYEIAELPEGIYHSIRTRGLPLFVSLSHLLDQIGVLFDDVLGPMKLELRAGSALPA